MAKVHFTDEFKRDAVDQIVDRGYSVAEVSKRLGVSQHSLYEWKKKFSGAKGAVEDNRDAEIRQLKRELARVIEERDILKRGEPLRTRISPGMPSEIRVYRRASFTIFCSGDVPLSACPSERLLCMAEGPPEQASAGGSSADGAHPQGMG